MKLVKTDLRGLSSLQILSRARISLAMMNGNPNFPDPKPSLAEITAACMELRESLSIVYSGASKLDFQIKRDRTKKLSDLYKALAAYVSIVAMGNASIVLSAGFQQRKSAKDITTMSAPGFPKANTGSRPCTVDLSWETVHGARMYKVYGAKGYDADSGYEVMLETSNSRCVVEGLEPMEYYTFRVEALGANAVSPQSIAISAASVGQRAA